MDWNLILACAHHLAVFGLFGIFAAEFALLRPGLGGQRVRQLAKVDLFYGIMSGVVVIVGIVRVIFGSGDPWYYLTNHAFWGKMAAFAVVGLLSIYPTMTFRKWLKAGEGAADYIAPDAEISRSRRFVHLQAGVFLLIPIFAAAMARGYGS